MEPVVFSDFDSKEAVNAIWGNASSRLGFLTSYHEGDHNIMTVEWTSHVQFRPPMIAVSLVKGYQSVELVTASREFGLCYASADQEPLLGKLGKISGSEVDKFSEFDLAYEDGTMITPRMFLGGVMAVECKIKHQIDLDGSILFVGEVVYAKIWDRLPVGYHKGTVYRYGEIVERS
ncbi:MAG: flavin reductase family protein [Candidatus Kariarchaeaceae archaeon]|jgi:flavin reductase (DIM6/NTAB) family NADH-FMN oxidoreductase RutF